MWKSIDFDEAFRRTTLIALAIWRPIYKLAKVADDNLPLPLACLVLFAPFALATWYLPRWVLAVPLGILFLSGAWIVMHMVVVTIESERLKRRSRRY